MSTVSVSELLSVYTTLVETLADIDNLPPGVERAHTWHKLNTSKHVVRRIIEATGATVEVELPDRRAA